MTQFEKEYYESSAFWENEVLQDADNIHRFDTTTSLIPTEVKRIVDVGCGNGVFANRLKRKNPELEIYAVDRSEKALEYVETNKIQSDITSLPFQPICKY